MSTTHLYLSDDILHMICTQLRHRRDFDTLFNLACSGKQLAAIALTNLYRIYDVTPVICGGGKEEKPSRPRKVTSPWPPYRASRFATRCYSKTWSQDERIFEKWATLWRSIILSSLGKTLYPYSQYIRTLNLGDLKQLIRDSEYLERIKDSFQGELAQFKIDEGRGRHYDRARDMANNIGEAITQQTPRLERLTGTGYNEELSRWIPRLPRLTHLKLEDGAWIEGHGNLVRLHCPSFKRLELWDWRGKGADQDLAAFLNELHPQSLESFQSFKSSYGPRSFRKLSSHGESLIQLKLHVLRADMLPNLPLLKGCINLISLSLSGNRTKALIDFEKSHNDAFLKTAAWLKKCKKLRSLALTKFSGALALMTLILLENSIHLTSLAYIGKELAHNEKFYEALANQSSLQCLRLRQEADMGEHYPERPEATDFFVESLSELVNLTDLCVTGMSASFTELHIMRLAHNLPKLEAWSISADALTDKVWGAVASLRSLRRLRLNTVHPVDFTADGILDFIEKLGPGNKGLIVCGRPIFDMGRILPGEEQKSIQDNIAKKVNGRFKMMRQVLVSPFSSDEEALSPDEEGLSPDEEALPPDEEGLSLDQEAFSPDEEALSSGNESDYSLLPIRRVQDGGFEGW